MPLVEEYSILLEAYKEIAQKYLLGEITFAEANEQMELVRMKVYG